MGLLACGSPPAWVLFLGMCFNFASVATPILLAVLLGWFIARLEEWPSGPRMAGRKTRSRIS